MTSLLPAALAATASGAVELSLSRLEPSVIPPYQAVTVQLIGSGFDVGAEVLIESSASDRYVSHLPSRITAELCEIDLPLGFGPRPPERRVYLRNPNGDQTPPLVLQIRSPESAGQAEPAPADDPPDTPEEGAVQPRILGLRPPSIVAGRPVFLQVVGSGFADGAAIEVTANLNAGSTRLPDYGARAFVAEWIDAELLEVDFDRGFYPVPGVRDVVVVNPDGARSNPASLHIQPEEKEQ